MIAWSKHVGSDGVTYTAEVGHLVLYVERGHGLTWQWWVRAGETVLGDGLAESVYYAKRAARRRVDVLVGQVERVLRSRRRA